jgi:hypothetical protein
METLLTNYHLLFPKVGLQDWTFALLALLLHAVLKLTTVSFKKFKWRIFLEHFVIVWFIAIISIVLCLGILPSYLEHYTSFDSAIIGYTSGSLIRQLLKEKSQQLIIDN